MSEQKRRYSALWSGVSAAAALMTGALAQPAIAQETSAGEEEIIVVTAQHREQDILDVPASVTAIGADEIADRGMASIEALQYQVPNVAVSNENQTVSPRFSIRGISSNTRNIGFEPGLAVYMDGVYTGRPGSMSFDLTDVASIEVLRGPQGTLYGRNNTAGAINITSRRPGDEWDLNFLAEAGNFDLLRFAGDASGPLTENLGAKLALYSTQRDGTVLNVFNGNRFNDIDSLGGRFGLYWEPSSDFEAVLLVDYTRDRRARSTPEPVTGQPLATPGPRTLNVNLDGNEDRDAGGVSLTLIREFGDGYELTSISGYRATNLYNQRIDNDDSPAPAIAVNNWEEEVRQFSEEVRLTSPDTGAFDWILGAYFFEQTIDSDRPVVFGGAPFANTVGVETQSFALFGQMNWSPVESLTLTLGGRYTRDDRELVNFIQQAPFLFPTFGPLNDSIAEENFSPMAAVVYEVNESLNLYGTIARGYKGGGFNADYISSIAELSFGPETVTNYEAGIKGTLNEGRLRFALAAFHMDYQDLQVISLNTALSGFFVENAAQASIDGVELELDAQLTDTFGVIANIGVLDAVYDSFPNGPGGDYGGNRLQDAPELTANIGLRYEQPLATGGSVYGLLDWSYRGDRFLDADNNVTRSYVPNLSLLSGRAGYRAADGRWELSVWGQNLADETEEVYRLRSPFTGNILATYNDPRMYGVTLRLSN